MKLQPEDFWSYSQWLMRPESFLESALLQGIVLIVLAIVLALIVGYIVSAARYGPGEGFYAVARATRDLVFRDLPHSSPRRIYALARLAFKEAIRKKVLFVFGLFVVLLLVAGWFLNNQSDDPGRLYISFVLTATNYLILALALFISTFSIPADIKEKTIYTIVTKPVRATELVLGRMLGFIAVGTVVLVPMGLLSYLFVTRGLDHTHPVVEAMASADGGYTGTTDMARNHKHTFSIAPGEDRGLTDRSGNHEHLVTKIESGDDVIFEVSDPVDALSARVPSYGEITFLDRSGDQKSIGIDIGNESIGGGYGSAGVSRLVGITREAKKIEYGYVEGGDTLSAAEFIFSDVTPERFGDEVLPLEMQIRAFRSYKGNIEKGIRGSLTLKHPTKPIQSTPFTFFVNEYNVDEQLIPVMLRIERDESDPATADIAVDGDGLSNLYDTLVDENGQLKIILKCLDDSQYLGVTRSGLYLRPAKVPFIWNLAKAYISIWLQMVMITAFGVMFSTRLSGPVAMVVTAVCVLLGFSAEQIYDTRHYIDSGVERGGGPIESLIRLVRQDALTTQLDLDMVTMTVVKKTDAAIVYSLDAIATALPNLPKMVETAEYAASGFDIFGALLLRHATATLGYFILAFLISYFFLKAREIAA